MKILIVDDELVSRKKMEKILQRYGECHVVDSAGAALEAYSQSLVTGEYFELITLDVSMPDMDGTKVLSIIRAVERNNSLTREEQAKILMVTSHGDHDTVVASIKEGCDDYIVKPFSLERVTRKLVKMGLPTLPDVPPAGPDDLPDAAVAPLRVLSKKSNSF